MSWTAWPFETAHHMGLVPLLWLAGLTLTGRRLPGLHWWLACAFGVSWVADWASHWYAPALMSTVYPVVQSGMIVAAVAPTIRWEAAGTLLLGALAALLWPHLPAADLLPRSLAWLGTTALVWPRRDLGALRSALLVAFGLGWVAWLGYHLAPGWTTYGLYQGVRAVSLGWFCVATWKPAPPQEVAYQTV